MSVVCHKLMTILFYHFSKIYDDDITEDPYENTVGSRGETVTKEENAHFSDLKKWLQATLKDTKVNDYSY